VLRLMAGTLHQELARAKAEEELAKLKKDMGL